MVKIIILDIPYSFGDTQDRIHPVALDTGSSLVLADCAFTGFLPKIEESMRDKGLDCARLTHVVITHHDHDHMGSLAELKAKYSQVLVAAGEGEEPYISGKRKPLRLEQAEALQESLPKEQKDFGERFMRVLREVKPVGVDILLRDGDAPDWLGGGSILATPGHTRGHISILLKEEDALIAGDAAVSGDGRLALANPGFASDAEEAGRSLSLIQNSGVSNIICFHGGLFRTEG